MSRLFRNPERRVDLGVLCLLAIATLGYLWLARNLFFYQDEWTFISLRYQSPFTAPAEFLAPHNEHWVALPLFIQSLLFATFGLGSYLPFVGASILAHIVTTGLAYLVLCRVGASRSAAAAAAGVGAFLGAGAENILWGFQIGFILPLLLGYLAIWAVDREESRLSRFWAPLALLAAVTSTGIGPVVTMFTAGYAVGRRGLRAAIRIALPALVLFGAWYLARGVDAVQGTVSEGTDRSEALLATPTYVWIAFTAAWDGALGVPGVGAVVGVVMLVAVTVAAPASRLRLLALSGMGALVLQMALVSMTRLNLDLDFAATSRYQYTAVFFTLPAFAVAVDTVLGLIRERGAGLSTKALGWALIGLIAVHGMYLAYGYRNVREASTVRLSQRVAASLDLAERHEPLLSDAITPELHPHITVSGLNRPGIRDSLPDAFGPQDLLDARSRLQVLITGTPPVTPATFAEVQFTGKQWSAPTTRHGCRTAQAKEANATLTLTGDQFGLAAVLTGRSPTASVVLVTDRGRSTPRPWSLFAGGADNYVLSTIPGAQLELTLEAAGPVTICPIPDGRLSWAQ